MDPEFAAQRSDRQTIGALWGILWTARNRAIHPSGTLGRHNLIAPEGTERLSKWVAKMDCGLLLLLDGGSVELVFNEMDAC